MIMIYSELIIRYFDRISKCYLNTGVGKERSCELISIVMVIKSIHHASLSVTHARAEFAKTRKSMHNQQDNKTTKNSLFNRSKSADD